MNRRIFLGSVLASGTLMGISSCSPKNKFNKRNAETMIKQKGIVIPKASGPKANYATWRKAGNLVFIAGQGPDFDNPDFIGRLGENLSIEQGYQAARSAILNNLAQLRAAIGSLDLVLQCVKMEGFVNSTNDFKEQPKVLNGATDLLVEIFGDSGRPARYAVGVNTLPFNISVEISTVWEVI